MLARAVQSYLSVRRAAGYLLKHVGLHLKSFAAYADAKRQRHVTAEIAVEWGTAVIFNSGGTSPTTG